MPNPNDPNDPTSAVGSEEENSEHGDEPLSGGSDLPAEMTPPDATEAAARASENQSDEGQSGNGEPSQPEGDYTIIYAKDPGYMYWEMLREHLKETYFSFVLFFDIASDYTVDSNLPQAIKTRKSSSGWTVIEGEDYVLITPGISAFEEYGHRKRLLDTIDDVCKHELLHKGWITVVAEGVNEWVTSVAWVMMHRDGKVKTTAFAPTELSDQILAKCDVFVEIAPRITAAPST